MGVSLNGATQLACDAEMNWVTRSPAVYPEVVLCVGNGLALIISDSISSISVDANKVDPLFEASGRETQGMH